MVAGTHTANCRSLEETAQVFEGLFAECCVRSAFTASDIFTSTWSMLPFLLETFNIGCQEFKHDKSNY